MPSWGIHLAVTKKLIEKIKLNKEDKNEFILANILPDINNGYVVKEIGKIIPHKQTHFEPKEYKGDYTAKPGYINFYEKYKNNLNNVSVLGYYTHLMTDFYFNNVTYSEYGVYDENNNRIGIKLNNGQNFIAGPEECRKIKVNDFKIFSFYIYKNMNIESPKYNENILEHIKKIEDINLNKEDLQKTIEYINECINNPHKILETITDENYKIYTQEELKQRVELCANFIMDNLNKNRKEGI